jgi:hypothetical protein
LNEVRQRGVNAVSSIADGKILSPDFCVPRPYLARGGNADRSRLALEYRFVDRRARLVETREAMTVRPAHDGFYVPQGQDRVVLALDPRINAHGFSVDGLDIPEQEARRVDVMDHRFVDDESP